MTEKKQTEIIEFVPFGTKDKISLTIEIVKRLIAVKTKTGKSCSDEDAFRFMLMCSARRLNPFEGDAFLIGYDSQSGPSFSLITAHQAFLKRAELHPEFDGMESGTIVMRKDEVLDLLGDWHMQGDRILGGWATVYFKNRKYPMKKRLRLERFNKRYGIWNDDPAGMIVKCAEADALRSAFPTMLGGLYITEEVQRVEDIPRAVFPDQSANDDKAQTTPQTEKPVVQAELVVEPPKKKATSSSPTPAQSSGVTLQRKTKATEARSTDKPKTKRDMLQERLAVGDCTPAVFIALAVREGWLTPEEAVWDEITDDRFEEWLKDENFAFIMQLLDEIRAPVQTQTTRPAQKETPIDKLL